MSRTLKIDRARRNALKAGTLVLGALLATSGCRYNGNQNNNSNRGNSNQNSNSNGGNQNSSGSSNCFVRGTRIRTREGYRPIETLAVGDEIAARFEGFAPIKRMVSHTLQRVSGKWSSDSQNFPVLIRRGALGENSPDADLCITALHLVYVDGFLMKAGDLVNGTSITSEAAGGRDTLDFFNIELNRHDILDAQGAFCESQYRSGMERCAPLLGFVDGTSKLRSRLRSAASVVIDRRQPIDIIRDKLEERGIGIMQAA